MVNDQYSSTLIIISTACNIHGSYVCMYVWNEMTVWECITMDTD